jgi:hypothetical protein
VSDELERKWNETVVTYFKVLKQHLPGRTDGIIGQDGRRTSGVRSSNGNYRLSVRKRMERRNKERSWDRERERRKDEEKKKEDIAIF